MFRTSCLVCNSNNLVGIIDLGIQPFADTFISEENFSHSEATYPLICDLCTNCGHVQTACKTDPKERYFLFNDYSYTSSNSSFARQHWKKYANDIPEKIGLFKNSFVVEIGSNDGFLSEQLLKRGYNVLGVDPSNYMAQLAEKRGVKTIVNLFTDSVAERIINSYKESDLIIANNVFNHSDNPIDFIKGVAKLLSEKGTFVFEQPYWLTSIQTKKFDQIYHEHVSYFTVKSVKKLLSNVGMVIWDVEEVNYHGGSLRIYAKKEGSGAVESKKVKKILKTEEEVGLFNPEMYEIFMKDLLTEKNAFMKKLYKLKEDGETIIAVGAPAKGNTFLNFYNLDKTLIDYVTDSSIHKQGKYTPLTRIPIVGDDIFSKFNQPYALVLSWNLAHKLKPILEKINPGIKFIVLE